jgi:hypothetical protein
MRFTSVLLTAACLAAVAASATACSSGSKTAAAAPATAAANSSPGSSGVAPGGGSGQDLNACALLSVTRASSLGSKHYSAAKAQVIAAGQDQCTYKGTGGGSDLIVIVYQPVSGVTWQTMTSVLKGTGTVTSVSGVGDKAMVGAIELDAQAGSRLVAVLGAGGTLTGDHTAAAAIAKAVIAALP